MAQLIGWELEVASGGWVSPDAEGVADCDGQQGRRQRGSPGTDLQWRLFASLKDTEEKLHMPLKASQDVFECWGHFQGLLVPLPLLNRAGRRTFSQIGTADL